MGSNIAYFPVQRFYAARFRLAAFAEFQAIGQLLGYNHIAQGDSSRIGDLDAKRNRFIEDRLSWSRDLHAHARLGKARGDFLAVLELHVGAVLHVLRSFGLDGQHNLLVLACFQGAQFPEEVRHVILFRLPSGFRLGADVLVHAARQTIAHQDVMGVGAGDVLDGEAIFDLLVRLHSCRSADSQPHHRHGRLQRFHGREGHPRHKGSSLFRRQGRGRRRSKRRTGKSRRPRRHRRPVNHWRLARQGSCRHAGIRLAALLKLSGRCLSPADGDGQRHDQTCQYQPSQQCLHAASPISTALADAAGFVSPRVHPRKGGHCRFFRAFCLHGFCTPGSTPSYPGRADC